LNKIILQNFFIFVYNKSYLFLKIISFSSHGTILIEKNRQVVYTGFYTVLEYLETVTGGESK